MADPRLRGSRWRCRLSKCANERWVRALADCSHATWGNRIADRHRDIVTERNPARATRRTTSRIGRRAQEVPPEWSLFGEGDMGETSYHNGVVVDGIRCGLGCFRKVIICVGQSANALHGARINLRECLAQRPNPCMLGAVAVVASFPDDFTTIVDRVCDRRSP